MIEVNVHTCPPENGKRQVAHDPDALAALIRSIDSLGDKPLGLKLPPYFEASDIAELAQVFNGSRIAFITCISSMPNALVIDADTETVVIKPKNGIGGLGGPAVKPFALANVYGFSQKLRKDIAVIGVGGILTGQDAFEFLLAGATAVQVGTTFYEQGPDCFGRIKTELDALLDRKGYATAMDARGKLKTL